MPPPPMSAAEAQEFISEVWGLQGAAYGVLCVRYYARISTAGWGGLAWDDFCMLLATVSLVPYGGMLYPSLGSRYANEL